MEGQKRAWIYCAIDAPEDSRNTLKDQRQQLMDYAEQMGFEIAGSASDTGRQPFWERSGFCEFIESAKNGRTDILLLASLHCIGCEFPYKLRVMGTSELLKTLKAPYMVRNPMKWGFF